MKEEESFTPPSPSKGSAPYQDRRQKRSSSGRRRNEVVEQVLEEGTYEIRAHPDREHHPNQVLLIFEFRAYTWVCPAVLDAREEAHMRETLARASRRQRKDAKITLRLPAGDLLAIKAKARRLGVEYQPLIAELIHQYAAGELRRTD